ncbi:hypothetical protein GCM10010178_90550 [Lentzea flava]|uniref:Uncharacterized protein n=1 Tax=Lentzea flava TaxID=103732 RepID=A0ABQ2VGY3_9PSEU|nr:hypothetical protein [Lentzea flava]GGU86474.1 hypothetical protein GCM10010178_90550 [Lentzea flava]
MSQNLSADAGEGHALLPLRKLLSTFLAEREVERICVLQAGFSQFRGPSASRVKAEGNVQLVGADLQLAVLTRDVANGPTRDRMILA